METPQTEDNNPLRSVDISNCVKGGWLLKMPEDLAADWKRKPKGSKVGTINKRTGTVSVRHPFPITSRLKIKKNVRNTKIFSRNKDGQWNFTCNDLKYLNSFYL